MPTKFNDILPCADAEELVDFTCSTPWERLVLDVELQLREWDLCTPLPSDTPPSIPPAPMPSSPHRKHAHVSLPTASASTTVSLSLRTFTLTYYSSPDPEILSILGVRRCVVLGPCNAFSVAAVDASDAASLLSSLTAAATAARCYLPMIVRVGPPDALRLLGRASGPAPKRFCCDSTSYPPSSQAHLPGVLHLFHNKRLAARRLIPPSRSDARVAANYTYYWSDFSFKLTPAPHSFANDPLLAPIHRKLLSTADPVPYLVLTVIWEPFPATARLASSTVSAASPVLPGPAPGMSPRTAATFRLSPPRGAFTSAPTSIATSLPLTAPVSSCLRLTRKAAAMTTRVRPAAPRPLIDIHAAAAGTSSAFDLPRLSDSQSAPALRSSRDSPVEYGFGAAPRSIAWREYRRRNQGPWSMGGASSGSGMGNFITQTRQYVAAAAVADDNFDEDFMNCAIASLFAVDAEKGIVAEVVEALGPGIADMTAAERLAALASWNDSVTMTRRLWGLFLDGVELHWMMGWPVRGVPYDAEIGPSTADCLLAQKLQMLNCCMHRLHDTNLFGGDEESEESGMGRKKKLWAVPRGSESETEGGMSDEDVGNEMAPAAGESSKCDGFVWEPHVQPIAYVTRDMAEAEQAKIVELSESPEPYSPARDATARRQSAALRSDMASFKAANPGASMADFVRWFSPTDWVELVDEMEDGSSARGKSKRKASGRGSCGVSSSDDDDCLRSGIQVSLSRGRLSARMSKAGNIWQEMWDTVQPMLASNQAPLFDAHLHGLKALSDLRALPMKEVMRQLACVQAMYSVGILQRAFERPPVIAAVVASIATARQCCVDCQQITPESDEHTLAMIGDACDKLAIAEQMALGAQSLLRKIPEGEECFQVINALVCGEEIDVTAERYRLALSLVAGMEEGGWRTPLIPSYREFVLEGSDSDRMNVKLSSELMRVGMQWNITYGSLG